MAETSGFFQAVWDASLKNPITEEYTGWWDRDYPAQSFADMFALFIGNGVFGSPTNQLKVIPGTGLNVIVTPGWAFINGTWYHNDTEKIISVPANSGSTSRIDSIKVRFTSANRESLALGFVGETSVTRTAAYYDLKLAEYVVPVGAVEISAANITDTRMNESVCGFVKGLMEVETTEDLFAQYEAIFDEWFDSVKGQVTGDLAIRLQLEFTQINADIQQYRDEVASYQSNVTQQISDYKDETLQDIADYEAQIASQISGYNTNYQETLNQFQTAASTYEQQIANQISGYNENYQETLDDCEQLVETYTTRDFVIAEQQFAFTNNVCRIEDARVTETSLVDVYFTQATINEAVRCAIYVESYNGYILLTAQRTPTSTIRGTIGVRVR